MKIHVTAEDIAAGKRWAPRECAVACALNRMGIPHAGVGATDKFLVIYRPAYPGVAERGRKAPAWVGAAVAAWDRGFDLQPFEFEVDDK
jgi:hypothetical protein